MSKIKWILQGTKILTGLAYLKTSTHNFPEPHFLMLTTSFSFQESFLRKVFLGKFLAVALLTLVWKAPSFPWKISPTAPLLAVGVFPLRNFQCFTEVIWTVCSFICSLIHLLNTYLLSAYHVPGILLGAWNTSGNKQQKPLPLCSLAL